MLQKLGYNVLGIESSKTATDIANLNGIKTLNYFFNEKIGKKSIKNLI